MTTLEVIPTDQTTYHLVDRFEDDRPAGHVVGFHSPKGVLRRCRNAIQRPLAA